MNRVSWARSKLEKTDRDSANFIHYWLCWSHRVGGRNVYI